jgi:UPF0716 family protein affecting phage T7 exclusion
MGVVPSVLIGMTLMLPWISRTVGPLLTRFREIPNTTNTTNAAIADLIGLGNTTKQIKDIAEKAVKEARDRENVQRQLAQEATRDRIRAENAAEEARRQGGKLRNIAKERKRLIDKPKSPMSVLKKH